MVGPYDTRQVSVQLCFLERSFGHPNKERRLISVGIRGRPLSTPEPNVNQEIPVDDVAWEQDVSHRSYHTARF
jgi:hypothetical protein